MQDSDQTLDHIVEQIAAEGWMALPGFLDAAAVRALALESVALFGQGVFHEAAIGGGAQQHLDGDVRADQIFWLEPAGSGDAQRDCLARFEDLRLRLNRDLQLGLFDFECHFARYAPGAFYRRHVDQFSRDSRRRVSSILYLNPDWGDDDGGELRLYLERKAGSPYVDIRPTGGTLVLFRSERFPHEVLPATRERLSLTGWYKARG
jgi:SM-20-related protein